MTTRSNSRAFAISLAGCALVFGTLWGCGCMGIVPTITTVLLGFVMFIVGLTQMEG